MPLGNASFIYDADGNQVQKLTGAQGNRVSISIEEIPLDMQHAIVAVEDARFYEHNGIDPSGIIRAFVVGVSHGFHFTEGASTITQQLLKNNVFTDWMEETRMQSFKRKIQEKPPGEKPAAPRQDPEQHERAGLHHRRRIHHCHERQCL